MVQTALIPFFLPLQLLVAEVAEVQVQVRQVVLVVRVAGATAMVVHIPKVALVHQAKVMLAVQEQTDLPPTMGRAAAAALAQLEPLVRARAEVLGV
jgi:hypothetical protein